MDTNRLKRFATEARNILMQGVVHRLSALGFLPDGSVTEEPQQQGGGATFMGDTVTQDFYDKWQSLRRAVSERKIEEVAEEAQIKESEDKKIKETIVISSPITGIAADLSTAPDPAFAGKMMGDGAVVTPTERNSFFM